MAVAYVVMADTGHCQNPLSPIAMSESEYLETRVDDQIAWYGKKSGSAKTKYFVARGLEITVAAFIPFMLHFWEWEHTRKIVAFCGVLIVGINGLLGLFKWGDLWKNYRTTSETLKHHRFLFTTKCAPYDGEGAFCVFVNNIEREISEENSDWKQIPFEKTRSTE